MHLDHTGTYISTPQAENCLHAVFKVFRHHSYSSSSSAFLEDRIGLVSISQALEVYMVTKQSFSSDLTL